jgi:histidyl-tRNA synthetase
MRDLLPDEVDRRAGVLAVIERIYRERGFRQIETPAVEHLQLLTAGQGGENEKLIYKILKRGDDLERAQAAADSELSDLGLRFDLTVPLTRYFAEHAGHLPQPFKAIQVGPVWRAERPQKGRYRQFTQCDIDILGDGSILAEVDLLDAACAVMNELEVTGATVRINDRRLLQHYISGCGVPDTALPAVFIELDKIDKVGVDGVLASLETIHLSEGVRAKLDPMVRRMIALAGGTGPEALIELAEDSTDEIKVIAEELFLLRSALDEVHGDKVLVQFDPLLVRGMGYYTGPIFELGSSEVSYSIGGGGRYDRMIGKWTGTDVPACGISFGFERLVELVDRSTKVACLAVLVEVAVDSMVEVAQLASELRSAGHSVSLVPRSGKLDKQHERLRSQGYAGAVRASEPQAIRWFAS